MKGVHFSYESRAFFNPNGIQLKARIQVKAKDCGLTLSLARIYLKKRTSLNRSVCVEGS